MSQTEEERRRLTSQLLKLVAHPDWVNLFSVKIGGRRIVVAGSQEQLLSVIEEVNGHGFGAVLATPGEAGEFCLLELVPPSPQVSTAVGVAAKHSVSFIHERALKASTDRLIVFNSIERYHFSIVDRGQRISI